MRAPLLLILAFPAAALAQAQQSASPHAPAGGDDKIVCKSFADVGSLIATHKECKTKREWAAEAAESQRHLADCVNTGAATGSHC